MVLTHNFFEVLQDLLSNDQQLTIRTKSGAEYFGLIVPLADEYDEVVRMELDEGSAGYVQILVSEIESYSWGY